MSRTSTAALVAVVLLSGGAWIVGSADPSEDTVTTTAALPQTTTTTQAESPPTPAPTTTTMPATTTTEPPPPPSVAAKVSGPVEVFESPESPDPFRTLPELTILGTPTVVSVLDDTKEGWVEAMLPGRPNGETGWIRADQLEIFSFDREVVVDLSERLLTVYTDGIANFQTDVAIGSDRSPTPTGTFFVTDAVELTRTNGPWGPFAFGLSARSDVVTEFAGGDGIIGIHGTNQPWSIGEAASLGCVRLPNDVMATLWEIVAVGMKVTIND